MRPVKGRWRKAQSLVEFTMVLPLVMTFALSIAEFGVAYGTNMSLIEATREGARVGAVLGNGSGSLGCSGATGSANVDPQILLAVQRVLESPGSGIVMTTIDSVQIYNADTSAKDTYTYAPNSGTVCGATLDFLISGSAGWAASARSAAAPADSLGVRIQYRYKMFTPLSALTGLVGLNTITMVDSTVMDIEP